MKRILFFLIPIFVFTSCVRFDAVKLQKCFNCENIFDITIYDGKGQLSGSLKFDGEKALTFIPENKKCKFTLSDVDTFELDDIKMEGDFVKLSRIYPLKGMFNDIKSSELKLDPATVKDGIGYIECSDTLLFFNVKTGEPTEIKNKDIKVTIKQKQVQR